MSHDPWTLRDVTDEVDRTGAAARDQQNTAVAALKAEVQRAAEAGTMVLKDRDAVPFLIACGLPEKWPGSCCRTMTAGAGPSTLFRERRANPSNFGLWTEL
jgi:hypothetical protein